MYGTVAIKNGAKKLSAWINPVVAPEIRRALQNAQLVSVTRQVPMLLAVAALNTIIIMAVCAHNGIAFEHYGWMAGLVLYCIVRIFMWKRRFARSVSDDDIPRLLRMNMGASLIMISGLGTVAAYTFVTGTFKSELLIPMSLGFGSLSIAHCLYTLRPAAIGTVIMGIMPSSIAMIAVGDFDATMLGIAMLSVAILMIRFVTEQHGQLITSLVLEHQNHALANTDPLTGLANRRAIMAELSGAVASYRAGGAGFAVALLDLDGFKDVNDQLGHHTGDALLQNVAERLSASAHPGDRVGRLGGDEFIVLLRGVTDERDEPARTTAMMAALCRPAEIAGRRLAVEASLGFARFPQDGDDIEATLHAADTALYAAKRQNNRRLRHQVVAQSVAA